ncbi:hypothetical protein BG011_005796 [Mortierella polycephala]|uniref:Uncharacterized protein n=1 Tax=Mortierella polycephala TaxID=41804 RepID=A0A9P6TZW1_9FUNG|nr:hypothetical protein BG011_005796 [Mortierella polycephala]
MSGHGEDAPGQPASLASPQQNVDNQTINATVLTTTPDTLRKDHDQERGHPMIANEQTTTTNNGPRPSVPVMDNHSSPISLASNSVTSNVGAATIAASKPVKTKPRRLPPQSLPPGSIVQAQAQFPFAAFTPQLQLQVNIKACSTASPPTLNLVPATPGPPSSGNPKPTDLPLPNPTTLSKHKGTPVLPYLVTPKEEKGQAIWGLWDHDDGNPTSKLTSIGPKSSKGPPSTSGSSKVVTSIGAEAGRRALLALQSVAAEEGAPISSPKKKPSVQQLSSKFTILAPPPSSTLSVASAPVSPHKDRDLESIGTGMSQNTPFESISLPATPTATENRSHCLPDNGFFLAVMSVYWSNLVGPRIEQIWAPRVGCPDELTLNQLAKQILNGEVMRSTDAVEPKMVVLQEEGLIAMSYLYNANPSMAESCSYSSTTFGITTGTLSMSTKFVLSFVVPLVYLQNFSGFFDIMSDHAPVLIDILTGLRSGLRLNVALDVFAEEHLVPFVEDVMTMEAVAMAIEGAKVSHIALGKEGDQVFGREFINRAITSHLETNSSTVVVGNNITIMNMMINTLALFLSPEDRAKSCHARKQHRYIPDLFLQGIYTPSIGKQPPQSSTTAMDGDNGLLFRRMDHSNRLYHILSSPFPTTIVDTVRCTVEQTERFPKYTTLRSEYRKEQTKTVLDQSITRLAAWSASSQGGQLYQGTIPPQNFQKSAGSDAGAGGFWGAKRENGWTNLEWKGQKVVKPVQSAAPMIENLVRCVVGLPIEMREGYVRQWRRGLVKRALALVKFAKKEGVELAEQLEQEKRGVVKTVQGNPDLASEDDPPQTTAQSVQDIFHQLGLDSTDLSIVLGTAERLLPSITEFVRVHLGIE